MTVRGEPAPDGGGGGGGRGTGCLCDAEPGVFATFTFAVLAQHRPRRRLSTAVVMCSCGSPARACPVLTLAGDLLFAPAADPEPDP